MESEALDHIGNFLLWFNKDRWTSPLEAAQALVKRLERAGYAIERQPADYPFCDTATCPYWRGYCSRDPACNN